MSVSVIKRSKPLSVNPLKVAQPVGAAQAFLGLHRAMPMLHGSQGCTAFAKVLFVRHYREPIPLQTTAMDQISTVMGGDGNIVEGLKTICEKQHPEVIGLLSTGLTETQGTDLKRAVKEFRIAHPEFADVAVIPVNTPDYSGSFETGFAAAVEAIVEELVPTEGTQPGRRHRQVNVLAGPGLTPGDLEELKAIIEAFELRPLLLPDVSDSLDGHLTENDVEPLTIGGTPRAEIAIMGDSAATLVIGPSLYKAGDRLAERTGVPQHRFAGLMGLEDTDRLLMVLSELANRPVPATLERQRAQLLDAMVDTHFVIGQTRLAIAGECDTLLAATRFFAGVGAETVAAVVPTRGAAVSELALDSVKIGDLADLEAMAREGKAELLVGNSHASAGAERLGIPELPMGFPQYERFGGYQEVWVGYRGARRVLFDTANRLHGLHRGAIAPYRSIYKPADREADANGHAKATASAAG